MKSFQLNKDEIKKIKAWERGETLPSESESKEMMTEEQVEEMKKTQSEIQKISGVKSKEQVSKQKRKEQEAKYRQRVERERAKRRRKRGAVTASVGKGFAGSFGGGSPKKVSGVQKMRSSVTEGGKAGKG